jgi:hypothetical protein
MDMIADFVEDLIATHDRDRPSYTLPLETGFTKACLIYLFRALGTILYAFTAVVLSLLEILDDRYFGHMGNFAILGLVILQSLVIFAVAAIGVLSVGALKPHIPREVRAILAPYFVCLFLPLSELLKLFMNYCPKARGFWGEIRGHHMSVSEIEFCTLYVVAERWILGCILRFMHAKNHFSETLIYRSPVRRVDQACLTGI